MNLAIGHTETFPYSMNNHSSRFSDLLMPMNYHESIIHHDLCRVAMDGVLFERNLLLL